MQTNRANPMHPPPHPPRISQPNTPYRASSYRPQTPRRSEIQTPSCNSYTSPPCPRIPVADPAPWRTTCTRLGRPFHLCKRSRAGQERVLAVHHPSYLSDIFARAGAYEERCRNIMRGVWVVALRRPGGEGSYLHSSRSCPGWFQIRRHVRRCGWGCGDDQNLRIRLR